MRSFSKSLIVLLACSAVAASAGAALAQATATLKVVNKTREAITVSVDGGYGCNTSAGTTCSIPVTQGPHRLKAVRSDTGEVIETQAAVGAQGYSWTPWES